MSLKMIKLLSDGSDKVTELMRVKMKMSFWNLVQRPLLQWRWQGQWVYLVWVLWQFSYNKLGCHGGGNGMAINSCCLILLLADQLAQTIREPDRPLDHQLIDQNRLMLPIEIDERHRWMNGMKSYWFPHKNPATPNPQIHSYLNYVCTQYLLELEKVNGVT